MQCCLFEVQIALIIYRIYGEQSEVLSGFSVRLFCSVQVKTLCRYGCLYFLAALVLVCVDVMVMSSAHAMTLTGALGGGMSTV